MNARNRWIYGSILMMVIVMGLYSRSTYPLSIFLKAYAGDVLWASMVYLLLVCVLPKIAYDKAFVIAIVFSCLIECSQLLTFDWLVYLRTTPLRYVLGQGFVWSDLLCYMVGCFMACGVDILIMRRQKKKKLSAS